MNKINPAKIKAVVENVTKHCVKGDLSKWRYTNPLGARQLEGLSESQIAKWMEPTRTQLPSGLVVHEDREGDLGLFWATKISGISAFDVEGQCCLALVANARNKAIMISDPKFPHYPVGRAIFRMIWTPLGRSQGYEESSIQLGETVTHFSSYSPVLFVEDLTRQMTAPVDASRYDLALMAHCVAKADAMRCRLAVNVDLFTMVSEVVKSRGGNPVTQMSTTRERVVLRPSNGVVEWSETITERHDWVQTEEELVGPFQRCIYAPPGMSTHPVIEKAYGLEVEQSVREGLTKKDYKIGQDARAPQNFDALDDKDQVNYQEPLAKKQKVDVSEAVGSSDPSASTSEGIAPIAAKPKAAAKAPEAAAKAPEASAAQAEANADEAPLPEGWTKRMSRSKGVYYYVNEAQGVSQFNRPTA